MSLVIFLSDSIHSYHKVKCDFNYFSIPTRWRSWLRYCAASRKVAGSIPDGVIGIDIIFRLHSASNTNEYQEYFLGVKTAGS
jgi:hypothetical protein